jgi:hypothetical protein
MLVLESHSSNAKLPSQDYSKSPSEVLMFHQKAEEVQSLVHYLGQDSSLTSFE